MIKYLNKANLPKDLLSLVERSQRGLLHAMLSQRAEPPSEKLLWNGRNGSSINEEDFGTLTGKINERKG